MFIYLCIMLFDLKDREFIDDLGNKHILILDCLLILGPAGYSLGHKRKRTPRPIYIVWF